MLCLGPQPTYPTARPGTLSVTSNLNQREAGRSHTASSAQGRGQRAFLRDGGTGALLPPPTPEVCWAPAWGQARQQVRYSLRSCQRQASSLRQWLELSQEEPRPEDQEAEQQVQEELQEVRPWAAPGRLPGGASSQPAPSTSPGGSADRSAEAGRPLRELGGRGPKCCSSRERWEGGVATFPEVALVPLFRGGRYGGP